MAGSPSEDSDQPGHPPSLIRVFAVRLMVAKVPNLLHADSEDSDQTGRMPRLISVFAGRTCHFVGFVMFWRIIMCLVSKIPKLSRFCIFQLAFSTRLQVRPPKTRVSLRDRIGVFTVCLPLTSHRVRCEDSDQTTG